MNRAFATIIFGLAASLSWGSGDFSGGLASRRDKASSVVLVAYVVGGVLLIALALIGHYPQLRHLQRLQLNLDRGKLLAESLILHHRPAAGFDL